MIKGESPGNYWPGAFGSYKMQIISPQLKTTIDRLLLTLKELMKLSRFFFEKLYSSDITHMEQEQNFFLDALQLPNISELTDTDLGAALTMDEISSSTIRSSQSRCLLIPLLSILETEMQKDYFGKGIISK